ncbi:MAG: hypothetical protein LBN29_02395 [Mediterranea sp.]|nr:hypothetical protein [Mediterranea sp.]
MNKDKQFMIEFLVKELLEMLMDEYGWDISKAMDVLYSSETFAKLEDERSGLYYQGAVYVYSFLRQEIVHPTNPAMN